MRFNPYSMALKILGAALSRLSLTTTIKGTQLSSISRLQTKLSPPSITSLTCVSQSTISSAAFTSQTNYHTLHSGGLPAPTLCNLVKQPLRLPLQVRDLSTSPVCPASLRQMHRTGPIKKKRKNKNPLGDRPFARGVVLKTLIKKPKKPNSANRKCVLVRLTTGKEMVAFIPGEGHNLQEHNVVLVRPGRLRDVPGVKVRCVRGKYDLQHVIKKQH
ncbi:small ribosomal subunit protein uS12m-like isoform X2 [Scylla paramamosain]|uniref:small ribosomal subunit protein uS12m-like isoform X2 n=1 Tax=Scylla paramamosain TaxID=85552 RepID=UPI003082C722